MLYSSANPIEIISININVKKKREKGVLLLPFFIIMLNEWERVLAHLSEHVRKMNSS